MAQSSKNLRENTDSLTGTHPFWQYTAASAPNNWDEWLEHFFLVADLKEKCNTRVLLNNPDTVVTEPYPKPETAQNGETGEERNARESRNAALILKIDAMNAEARRKGPKIGHGAYFHEVDNSVKSRLFLSLGEEGKRKLRIKHPNLALGTETVKTLVEKLNTLFKYERNVTMERLALFNRNQKSGESLEMFYNALLELSKYCELGTLQSSLVKDLFVAKMNHKELQMKFCREKTSPEDVLKDIIIYERGASDSSTFQNVAKLPPSHIKQEPIFAVDKQSRGRTTKRGNFQQRRGGGVTKNSKRRDDKCRNCGAPGWTPTHDCPAKGKECSLCKRSGHFASVCRK